MAKYLSAVILAIASLQGASALAIREDALEVIPGPGMPSLESLGLTSAQLLAMPKPASLTKRATIPECGPSDGAYGPVANAVACYHYINALGEQHCGVPGHTERAEFCRSGDIHATGYSLSLNDESSYCRDVAAGLLWVLDSCTRPGGDVAGWNTANGNGNLAVGFTRTNW